MGQEMGGQEEQKMLKLKVHKNWCDLVRLRLLSVMKIGSLARWDCRHSVGELQLQPLMIHRFGFVVQELQAPEASSFEGASTCAPVQWAQETVTWSALCAFWLRSDCFQFLVPFQRRSRLASLLRTQALESELWEPEVVMVGHGQGRTMMLCRETDYHHLVVRLSQIGVAMLGIHVGWPLRDGVVASYVRQIDHRRRGNQDRGLDDPRQTATRAPNGVNWPDSYSAVASAGP